MIWSQVKDKFESMLKLDPQRATLALRAVRQVEEGLQFIAQQGYQFELAERGAMTGLRAALAGLQTRTLSMGEASELVQPTPVEAGGGQVFDAQ